MKFVVDSMLGKLAKWLRILGYDTLYVTYADCDKDLIELAEAEDRILLTRDTALARSWLVPTLLIKSEKIDEQIIQVSRRFNLDMEKYLLSRCPKCNITLTPIKKEKIKDKVPLLVYDTYKEFWRCKGCKRVYWTGTHWENIKKKIKSIDRRIHGENAT